MGGGGKGGLAIFFPGGKLQDLGTLQYQDVTAPACAMPVPNDWITWYLEALSLQSAVGK